VEYDVESRDVNEMQSVKYISKFYTTGSLGRDVSLVTPDPAEGKGYIMMIPDNAEKGMEPQLPKGMDRNGPTSTKDGC
jgi:hypothetical protein